jgi:hypothetical protein
MQPSFRFLLLLSLTVFSCATNDQKQEQKADTLISSADTTQKLDTVGAQISTQSSPLDTDTLTIDRKAAVFYQPDSLQMERRMKEVSEADFRAGADDYIYYVNTSAEYLEKEGLPVLDAKNKKYLKFVLADNRVQVIKLDTLEELWGMYLFDPKKKAYAADMTIIEDEYKNYFK